MLFIRAEEEGNAILRGMPSRHHAFDPDALGGGVKGRLHPLPRPLLSGIVERDKPDG